MTTNLPLACPNCGAKEPSENKWCLNMWHGSDELEERPGWAEERAKLKAGYFVPAKSRPL